MMLMRMFYADYELGMLHLLPALLSVTMRPSLVSNLVVKSNPRNGATSKKI